MDPSDSSLIEQDVVFVDISRMSAADILTIHQKLTLLKQILKPGQLGCVSFVMVSGDQPTYKMIGNIWRNSYLDTKRGNSGRGLCEDLNVHGWVIPFPGSFHVEKQSLYPICKEILHGLGLQELAACFVMSPSQVDNILKHSHARNNRMVLFKLCAALIVHAIDVVQTEQPDLKDDLERITRCPHSSGEATLRNDSKLFGCVTGRVTPSTVRIGKMTRKRVRTCFSHSPNGKHFMETVLFTCLLPTIGFHALSRTGHSDLVDSFWLRVNNILHTSGHLKYQELYMFYGFFRSIMPRVIFSDLFTRKPGSMLATVPNFTAGLGGLYDKRGWNYVHLDEAREMLIILLMKSLNVSMLQYLESCRAWLLVVSKARMTIRSVTAATHSYKRTRHDDETGTGVNPLQCYDKTMVQTNYVRAMVELMRRKWFLSLDRRKSEHLRNVFGDCIEDLEDDNLQKRILSVEEYGKKNAELHASAMLQDVFGPLSDNEIQAHFGGKRFKGQWPKFRQIPTAVTAMEARRDRYTVHSIEPCRDPRNFLGSLHAFKAMSDRRHLLTKLMTNLTLAEHAAIRGGDVEVAEHVRRGWNVLHSNRYIISPFADAYRNTDSSVWHSNKSQILSALNMEFMNQAEASHNSLSIDQARKKSVWVWYDHRMPQYDSVMIDLMNHIWSRGTDGRRGSSIFSPTVMKLKHLLRPWFSGGRSKTMKQLHLHIDDPSNVIPQILRF